MSFACDVTGFFLQISKPIMASQIDSEKDYSEAIAASHLAVLHFLADWAPECSTITAVLSELKKDPSLDKVKFFQLEAEKMPEISMKHEIVAVPTVLMFRNGKAVDRSIYLLTSSPLQGSAL